jgi:hypothetical protein
MVSLTIRYAASSTAGDNAGNCSGSFRLHLDGVPAHRWAGSLISAGWPRPGRRRRARSGAVRTPPAVPRRAVALGSDLIEQTRSRSWVGTDKVRGRVRLEGGTSRDRTDAVMEFLCSLTRSAGKRPCLRHRGVTLGARLRQSSGKRRRSLAGDHLDQLLGAPAAPTPPERLQTGPQRSSER